MNKNRKSIAVKKGPPLTKAKPVGKVKTLLTPSVKQRDALKAITKSKTPLRLVGCGLAPAIYKLKVKIDWPRLAELGHTLAADFSDRLDWIPRSTHISPATLVGYVVRVAKWFWWRCGMLDQMPEVNCDQYQVPTWLAAMLISHSPFVKEGVRFTPTIDEFTNEVFTLQEGEGVTAGAPLLRVQVPSTTREPQFSLGVEVDLLDTVFDNAINTLVSSLNDSHTVLSLRHFTDDSTMYRSATRMFASGDLEMSRYTWFRFDTYFRGRTTRDYTVFSEYHYLVHALATARVSDCHSFSDLGRAMGIEPASFTMAWEGVNMAYFNLLVFDALIVANPTVADFWSKWKDLMIYWQAYYFSFCPYFLRDVAVLGAPSWVSLNHRRALVTPQIAMLQKPGVYVEDGSFIFLYFNQAATTSIQNFKNPASGDYTWVNYTGVAGSVNQTYCTGTASFAQAVNLEEPAENQYYNTCPLGVYDELATSVKGLMPFLINIIKPKLHKCLCTTVMDVANDDRTVATTTAQYYCPLNLYCNKKMLTEMCCWMNGGCMWHLNGDPAFSYVLACPDRSNRLHDISAANALNGVKAVSVGQSRNVAESFIAVVRDQLFPPGGNVTAELSKNAVKKLIRDYYANDPNPPTPPTSEELMNVVSGTAPIGVALATLAGAASYYGPAIWNTIQQVRVAYRVLRPNGEL